MKEPREIRLKLEPELQKELAAFMADHGISVMDKQVVIKFYLARGLRAKDAQEYDAIEELAKKLDERKAARSKRQRDSLTITAMKKKRKEDKKA
jgi:hypothetical protein